MSEYKVTLKSSGREWILRPVPKHIYVMFGQLPSNLSATAVTELTEGNETRAKDEMARSMTAKQKIEFSIFAREAVKFACVNPKITLSPENDDEISPFQITEEEFNELVTFALRGGGEAENLKTFRG